MSARGSDSQGSGRPKRQSDKNESDPLGSLRSPLRPESSRPSARESDRLKDDRSDRLRERTSQGSDRATSKFDRRFTRNRKSDALTHPSDDAGYKGHLDLHNEGRQPRYSAKDRIGNTTPRKGRQTEHAKKPGDKTSGGEQSSTSEEASAGVTSLDWYTQIEMEEANKMQSAAKRPSSVDSGSTGAEDGEVFTPRKSARVSQAPIVLETDPLTIARRKKQIEYGKITPEYTEYCRVVPRHKRTRHHPQTPNKDVAYSRRGWDTIIKIWRKELHVWDPQSSKQKLTSDSSKESNAKVSVLLERNTSADDNDDVTQTKSVFGEDEVKVNIDDVTVTRSNDDDDDNEVIDSSMIKREAETCSENMSVDNVTKACEAAIRNKGEEASSAMTIFQKFGLAIDSSAPMSIDEDSLDLYGDL